jgi:hypothetical protein
MTKKWNKIENKGKGWHGESRRHSEAAKIGHYKLKPFGKKNKTFHLPIETAVLVPSTKDGRNLGPKVLKTRTKETRKEMHDLYGGYTSVQGVGSYTTKKGRVDKEGVNKVTSFTKTKDYRKNRKKMLKLLKEKKKKWGQDSMGYEIEGDLHYVE